MIGKNFRCMAALLLAANLALVTPAGVMANDGKLQNGNDRGGVPTTTPIKHVVVIFQENVSFDHYFATYPEATNPKNETPFFARPNTPTVNGQTPELIAQNHNSDAAGNTYPPFRLDPSQN